MCVIFVKPPGYSLKIALWHNLYFLASTIGGYYTMLPVYERLHWWQTLSLVYVELPVIHAGKGFSVQCMWCSVQHFMTNICRKRCSKWTGIRHKKCRNIICLQRYKYCSRNGHFSNTCYRRKRSSSTSPERWGSSSHSGFWPSVQRFVQKDCPKAVLTHDMVVTWEIVEFGAEYAMTNNKSGVLFVSEALWTCKNKSSKMSPCHWKVHW